MAKGVGLIGNFKGKVGNTVGYSLKDSNNKQTQGIRVYQPVVRNPKTYAQAEQRAKLAPINATYRALKMIIDRGQEGLAYGNKSRLAWLSQAMKSFKGAWFEKGDAITLPAWVKLTYGSLPGVRVQEVNGSNIQFSVAGVTTESDVATVGGVSTLLLAGVPGLQAGDQITFIGVHYNSGALTAEVHSIVLDTTSTESTGGAFDPLAGMLTFIFDNDVIGAAVVISREGDNGAHLRSTSKLIVETNVEDDKTSDDAKQAAIVSYMSQGANTDWAEESIMQ